jgi:ABC-type lipoprotein export system ATPase subunit
LYTDISYDFGVQGITAIFGISWSGKTTLLHIVWGLMQPQSGRVVFQGIPVHELTIDQLSAYKNKNVWFSFQDHVLLEDYTVQQNLHLPFLLWWWLVDNQWKEFLIETFGIQDLLHKPIQHISGWERERASLIKSLIHRPDVLILDEPGDSLDLHNREKLYQLIMQYAQDHIVIITSHNQDLVQALDLQTTQSVQHLQFFSSK